MQLRGTAALLYAVGNLSMAAFFGLTLLEDPLGVLDLTGAWRVVWHVAAVGMIAGLAVGLLLGLRDRRRQARS
jgi:membrane associated rhomboid family serine protease